MFATGALCKRLSVKSELLKLLACRACNNAKGAALPGEQHLLLAVSLSREWSEVSFASDLDRVLLELPAARRDHGPRVGADAAYAKRPFRLIARFRQQSRRRWRRAAPGAKSR